MDSSTEVVLPLPCHSQGLVQEPLHFLGDGLTVGAAQNAVSAFGAEADGASESFDNIAHSGIGHLEAALERV